jgi:very-short-patch-repair endonuclease
LERIQQIARQDRVSVGDRLRALDALWEATGDEWQSEHFATAFDLLTEKVHPLADGPFPVAHKLIASIAERADELPPARLAELAEGIIELDYFHHGFFHRIERRLLPIMDSLDEVTIARSCYAFAVADLEAAQFFAAAAECVSRRSSIATLGYARLAFALAIAASGDHVVGPILQRFLERIDGVVHECHFVHSEAVQLHRAMRLARHRAPASFRRVLNEAFRGIRRHAPRPNKFELDVRSTLRRLGLSHKPQGFVEGYVVDFILRLPSGRIVLECDGDRFHRKLPLDRLRDRLLLENGMPVLRLAFSAWIGTRKADRGNWLSAELAAVGPGTIRRLGVPGGRVTSTTVPTPTEGEENPQTKPGDLESAGLFRLNGPANLRVRSLAAVPSGVRSLEGRLTVQTSRGCQHVLNYRRTGGTVGSAPDESSDRAEDPDRPGGD